MFDSTIKVLEMKNMPIPQTIHAIATGPTAEFSAIFWGSPSTPLPIIELTTMNINAGHEITSKARIIHQIQPIRGITLSYIRRTLITYSKG